VKGRVLALDLGERRIGVAVSDSGRSVATPYSTIERGSDSTVDHRAVVSLVEEVGAVHVVVGLPLSMDGRRGEAARRALEESSALASMLESEGVAVEPFDERLTTVSASRALVESGRRGRSVRKVIDASAAAVLLQAWLDRAGAGK
jgi:putative Holliday junction resolvase